MGVLATLVISGDIPLSLKGLRGEEGVGEGRRGALRRLGEVVREH